MTATPSENQTAPQIPRSALTDGLSHLRLWLVTAALLSLDLWSKHWIFANLKPDEVRTIVPGVLEFQRSLNDGAVFGTMTGMVGLFMIASCLALVFVGVLFHGSSPKQRSLHIGLGLILAGALGNFYDRANMSADIITTQTGTKMIGKVLPQPHEDYIKIGDWPSGERARFYASGGIADVREQGVVRDFIKFVPHFPRWVPRMGGRDVWPYIFNIADSALVCGVILLLLNFWVDHRRLRAIKRRKASGTEAAEVAEGTSSAAEPLQAEPPAAH